MSRRRSRATCGTCACWRMRPSSRATWCWCSTTRCCRWQRMHAEAELAAARIEVESLRAAYREKVGEVAVARQASHLRGERAGAPAGACGAQARAGRRRSRTRRGRATLRWAPSASSNCSSSRPRRSWAAASDCPIDQHPTVRTAAAALEKTRVDLEHTIVRAPRAGIVSHLPQAGDRVEAGRPAFAIVTDGGVYVEANFKETDLEWVRPGETRDRRDRHLSRPRMDRQGREHRAGDRLRVRGAAAAERLGQLGEGRAARAGAHQHRSQGGRPAAAQRRERQRVDRHRTAHALRSLVRLAALTRGNDASGRAP